MTSTFPIAKLSEIAYLNPTLGGRLPEDELVSFVPMASVSAETAKVETTQDRPYSEVSKGFTPFLSGDVLFAKITPCFENGKIAQANLPRRNGFGSTEFHVVRSRPGVSDARYLHHYLRLKDVRTEGQRRMTGSGGQRRVPASFLSELCIPAPPLEEQRRIAAILDQAETLRTQRRAALAQLDSLAQSIFLNMFGDAEAKCWPIETIAGVAHSDKSSMRTGPFGSQLLHSEFVAEGVSVLGIDNAVANEFRWGERRFISEAKYRDLKRYTVKPGDVLITIMGTCGRCAVVPDDIPLAINTKHICCITLDKQKCLPEFLHAYFLRHPMARKYLAQTEKGAIMAGLNMGLIQAMPLAVPPLSLQQTFVTRLKAIEALKATHRTALAELDALFASLQQRAFSGQLTQSTSVAQNLQLKARDLSELCKFDMQKMLEAMLYVAKRMPQHNFYKSLKAVYFADKRHLENHGDLIYGETYGALDHGPVPMAAYDFSKGLKVDASPALFAEDDPCATLRLDGHELIPARDADFGKLSAEERESLDWAIRYVAPMNFGEVKTASHDTAYNRTPRNMPIQLTHIVEMLPDAARQKFFAKL